MDEYLIVIPYLASGSQGNELEYAVAGWRKHFKEKFHIVIVGDYHPIIDTGDDITFIKCPRVEDRNDGNYLPHIDIMNKLKTVRTKYCPNDEGFIFVADDCYAVNDFDINDIKFLKMLEPDFSFNENSTNGWRRAKMATKKLLIKEGYPTRNFTLHLPHWFEWDKVEELINRYDLYNNTFILEDLYFNIFYKDRIPFQLNKDTDNLKFGVYSSNISDSEIYKAMRNKIWITNSPIGWTPALQRLLKRYYNEVP